MRLIDADALMKELEREVELADDWKTAHEIANVVKYFPTIEPQRTGKWERHYSRPNVYADLYWHCSECGYKNDDQYANVYHNFCPNCGAKMEGR